MSLRWALLYGAGPFQMPSTVLVEDLRRRNSRVEVHHFVAATAMSKWIAAISASEASVHMVLLTILRRDDR